MIWFLDYGNLIQQRLRFWGVVSFLKALVPQGVSLRSQSLLLVQGCENQTVIDAPGYSPLSFDVVFDVSDAFATWGNIGP